MGTVIVALPDGTEATLNADLVWESSDPEFAEALNSIGGEPTSLGYDHTAQHAFLSAAKEVLPLRVVRDTIEVPSEQGRVY